jgi:hypothetical protein
LERNHELPQAREVLETSLKSHPDQFSIRLHCRRRRNPLRHQCFQEKFQSVSVARNSLHQTRPTNRIKRLDQPCKDDLQVQNSSLNHNSPEPAE